VPILGITGGVATGKTSFSSELRIRLAAELFDTDSYARALLAGDPEVRDEISRHFGEAIFAADGNVDRAKLRETVFRDESQRVALQQILHPRIRGRWVSLAQRARAAHRWLVVDIPLLFETKAEEYFDRVVVVACSAEVQRRRLLEVRGLGEETARGIIAAQLDLMCKMERSHHAIWNDSALPWLREQAILLGDYLLLEYG